MLSIAGGLAAVNGIDRFRHIIEQIKTLDYELHAALRIFGNDELEPDHRWRFSMLHPSATG